jgi:hypothetical protein
MTSEGIAKYQWTRFPRASTTAGQDTAFWLKEIAFQLAVMNERTMLKVEVFPPQTTLDPLLVRSIT